MMWWHSRGVYAVGASHCYIKSSAEFPSSTILRRAHFLIGSFVTIFYRIVTLQTPSQCYFEVCAICVSWAECIFITLHRVALS